MRISDWSADVCSSDLNRRLDLVGRHQPLGYARERPALQRLAPDRPVIDAGTAAMMAYASIAIANDDSISSATGAAFEQTREQIGRTAQPLNAPRLRRLLDRCVALGKHLLLTLEDRQSTR